MNLQKKGVDLFVENEDLKEKLNKALDDKNIIKNCIDAAINQKNTVKIYIKLLKILIIKKTKKMSFLAMKKIL